MRFSLIVGTFGRVAELERFLAHLERQSFQDFETIIVDQNPSGFLDPLLDSYSGSMAIRHLRCSKGVSRARNLGLEHASGEIVAFPDDDCWYPPDLLQNVSTILCADPDLDGVCGLMVDEQSRPVGRRTTPGPLTRFNSWLSTVTFALFFRKRALKDARFDELLGPGAGSPWTGGEERDFVLKMLERGARIRYLPDIVVNHPNGPRDPGESYGYGLGDARVFRNHRLPVRWVVYYLTRTMAGCLVSLARGDFARARDCANLFLGRLLGYLLARSIAARAGLAG
jgi:glycosyltransferase involved in cell wall biosynthesis